MAIVKWRGWNPVWPSFFEDEEFSRMSNWPALSSSTNGLDIYETDDNIVVEAQVPGVEEKDLVVTVEGNVLSITAEVKHETEKEDKKKTIYKATRQSTFNYSTSLPRSVDADKATADVSNGVVTVTIPKTEAEKPKRIQIGRK